MNLQDKINQDIKAAMLNKSSLELSVLRQLKNAFSNSALNGGNINAPISDLDGLSIIRKQIKQRQDSIAAFVSGNRQDLAENEKLEISVLEKYLPKSLDESRINAIVEMAINKVGATTQKQMGAVMKIALDLSEGRVDNKTLSQKIKEKLS